MGLWAVGGGARVLSPGEWLLWGEWLARPVPPEGLGGSPSSLAAPGQRKPGAQSRAVWRSGDSQAGTVAAIRDMGG